MLRAWRRVAHVLRSLARHCGSKKATQCLTSRPHPGLEKTRYSGSLWEAKARFRGQDRLLSLEKFWFKVGG